MKALAWQPGLAMRLRRAQRGALAGRQLGQAEDPAGLRAVRGAGVDDAGARVGHQRRRLLGRHIGQAQKGHIGGVEQARALGRVLAALGVDAQQLDVGALRQHLVDAQARRAFLTVDEDLGRHGGTPGSG